MYRKQRRIPTILALFIIFAGLGTALYLDRNPQTLSSLARSESIPEDIHISNVTDSSFTVSFITSNPTTGGIQVVSTGQKLTILDDLDSDNVVRPRKTHLMTAKNLSEQTSYSIKIVTGDRSCKQERFCPTLTQVTAPKLANPLTIPPLRGSVFTDNKKPANTALVYGQVGKNALLSTRADSQGLWAIPLTNLHTNDLSAHAIVSDEDLIQITVKLSPNEIATAVVDIKSVRQNFPVPEMIIGNSYNYVNLSSKRNLYAKNVNQSVLGTSQEISTSAPTTTPNKIYSTNILFPKQDFDTTPDSRPRIRGTGIAGTQILITVNSIAQTGKITVGRDGTWNWRPPKELPPGIHHLSISTYDERKNLVTQTRSFIVLKSGEQVLGESTPSASLTPTDTPAPSFTPIPTALTTLTPMPPSPTASPTSIPSPTNLPPATEAPPPRSGSIQPALYILGGGASLLLIGAALLLLP